MVALMGVFMIVAAYRAEWRKPILIYSAFEKTFMVYLVVANRSHSYTQGFLDRRRDGRDGRSLHHRLLRSVRIQDAFIERRVQQ
jgi:hypothetical protein